MASLKAAFTRSWNELKNETIKPEIDHIMIKRLKKQLMDRFTSLEKLDEEIERYLQGKDSSEEEFIEYRDKFGDMNVIMDELIEKDMGIHNFERESIHGTVITNHITRSKYKLPKLELQKFSGDPKEWLGWWSQFKGIHEDITLSAEHKFQYLVQATVVKSSAYDLVTSFPSTGENYPKAIAYLKSRFGNDKILVEVYVRELLGLVMNNSLNNHKNLISTLYDKLETQLRGLESLGVTSDKYAAMLYPLVESALPDEILKIWQRNQKQEEGEEEEDQLNLLMKFLRKEVDSEIRMKLARNGISNHTENVVEQNASMFSSNSTVDMTNRCYYCKKPGHIKPNCEQLKKLIKKTNSWSK